MILPRQPHSGRRAFSLVEILTVVAIIGILAALGAWGMFAVIGGRQQRNTQETMRVLAKVLQDHYKYVIDEAKKDTISPAIRALAAPDPTGERARVLWIKFRLKEAFPQSYADIENPFVYTNGYIPAAQSGLPSQQRYISQYQTILGNRTAANNVLTESSACLRIALSVSRGNSALNDEQIKNVLIDTDGDGIPEIVDGWNKPLAFFLFPWNNADLQANNPGHSNPQAKNYIYADPIDTGGTLINPSWMWLPSSKNPSSSRALFETNFHSVTYPNNPPAPPPPLMACYVTPVIVSAGRDGQFGLGLDANGRLLAAMSLDATTLAADNIFSYKQGGN